MEVHIGRGIRQGTVRGTGSILFGASEANIQTLLGDPDKQGIDDFDEPWMAYNSLRSTFEFNEGRLHWIRCSHPDLLIFGRRLLGVPQAETMEFLESQLTDAIDIEDYGVLECRTFRDNWLELQFEYGVLDTVCFGHLFGEDDEPIWPVAE